MCMAWSWEGSRGSPEETQIAPVRAETSKQVSLGKVLTWRLQDCLFMDVPVVAQLTSRSNRCMPKQKTPQALISRTSSPPTGFWTQWVQGIGSGLSHLSPPPPSTPTSPVFGTEFAMLKPTGCSARSLYSWPLNNAGLNCVGPLIHGFSPPLNSTTLLRNLWLVESRMQIWRADYEVKCGFSAAGRVGVPNPQLFKGQLFHWPSGFHLYHSSLQVFLSGFVLPEILQKDLVGD